MEIYREVSFPKAIIGRNINGKRAVPKANRSLFPKFLAIKKLTEKPHRGAPINGTNIHKDHHPEKPPSLDMSTALYSGMIIPYPGISARSKRIQRQAMYNKTTIPRKIKTRGVRNFVMRFTILSCCGVNAGAADAALLEEISF